MSFAGLYSMWGISSIHLGGQSWVSKIVPIERLLHGLASPFGRIATVGTRLICRAFAGTEFSGIEASSAPQSSVGGSEFLFVLAM